MGSDLKENKKMYEYSGYVIQDHMLEAIQRYVDYGIPPGGFLTAVICNDFSEAVGRADSTNVANLPAFAAYFYNEVPSDCHGSLELMENWMGHGGRSMS